MKRGFCSPGTSRILKNSEHGFTTRWTKRIGNGLHGPSDHQGLPRHCHGKDHHKHYNPNADRFSQILGKEDRNCAGDYLRCENRSSNRPAGRETGMEMPCCPGSDLLIFSKVKTSFPTKPFGGVSRAPKVGDGGVFHTPCTDFSRPVERLEYTCLLKSTFTEV